MRLTLNPPFFFESAVTYDVRTPGDIRLGFTDVQPQSQLAGQVRAWNPNLRPAFIQQWNFSTEYLLAPSFSINLGYVGQKGTHLVDPRESDLAPANDSDREKVAAQVPMTYESDRAKMSAEQKSATRTFEIWWLPLAAMIVLLCGELWLTRRIALNR